uniref:Uncharacterized protein n=1 Tax=Arundo donax TaxID=35708 RepID=A0A0A8XRN4_ARUDO
MKLLGYMDPCLALKILHSAVIENQFWQSGLAHAPETNNRNNSHLFFRLL